LLMVKKCSMKNAIFWDVTPWRFCRNRCLGGTYSLQHQGEGNERAKNNVSNI
jgi:hypothetical protein